MLSLDFSLKELPGPTGSAFCFILASLHGEAEAWAGELPNSFFLAVSLWLHLQGVPWERSAWGYVQQSFELGLHPKDLWKGSKHWYHLPSTTQQLDLVDWQIQSSLVEQ